MATKPPTRCLIARILSVATLQRPQSHLENFTKRCCKGSEKTKIEKKSCVWQQFQISRTHQTSAVPAPQY